MAVRCNGRSVWHNFYRKEPEPGIIGQRRANARFFGIQASIIGQVDLTKRRHPKYNESKERRHHTALRLQRPISLSPRPS